VSLLTLPRQKSLLNPLYRIGLVHAPKKDPTQTLGWTRRLTRC
jgi:hypothetical protein